MPLLNVTKGVYGFNQCLIQQRFSGAFEYSRVLINGTGTGTGTRPTESFSWRHTSGMSRGRGRVRVRFLAFPDTEHVVDVYNDRLQAMDNGFEMCHCIWSIGVIGVIGISIGIVTGVGFVEFLSNGSNPQVHTIQIEFKNLVFIQIYIESGEN